MSKGETMPLMDPKRPVSRAVEVDRAHQAQREEVPEGVLKMGKLVRGGATCFKPETVEQKEERPDGE